MHYRQSFGAAVGLVSVLAVLVIPPSEAPAYINAGFRSEGAYATYLAYRKMVAAKVGSHTANIALNPDDPEAYRRRARAWESLPRYRGPWPDGEYEREMDSYYQAGRDYETARRLEVAKKAPAPK